jgi:putative aminopeptidase FrvX
VNFELLKKLCETPGIPSREEQMREVVIEELRPLVDSISIDAMGNVVGIKKGKPAKKGKSKGKTAPARRVMLAAHMDEIGFMVKYIDDKGFPSAAGILAPWSRSAFTCTDIKENASLARSCPPRSRFICLLPKT